MTRTSNCALRTARVRREDHRHQLDRLGAGADYHGDAQLVYAGADGFVKPEVIDKMTAGLRSSGSGSEIVVFPNVNHGFNADYRPTYDKITATYATKLTLDWLKQRGV